MTKVFIAGSRSIGFLNEAVKQRVDNIIEKSLTIIIGDAQGIDVSIQKYLKNQNYENVIIFCMEGGCRNNIGEWPMRVIKASNPSQRDFHYYSTKDRAMAEEADYGFMLWDGKSRGTLANVVALLEKEVPVVLWLKETFYTLRESSQLKEITDKGEPA